MERNLIAFCGFEQCVDEETEYLTQEGWKKIKYYTGEPIAIYTKEGNIYFDYPQRYIKAPATNWYYINSCHGINQRVSEEHNIYYTDSNNELKHSLMCDIYKEHTEKGFEGNFITTFKTTSFGVNLTEAELRLIMVIKKEGTFKNNKIYIKLNEDNKVQRLQELLIQAKVNYEVTIGNKNTLIHSFYPPFNIKKCFKELWMCSQEQMKFIMDELYFWGGHKRSNGSVEYYTSDKQFADFIQLIHSCLGYKTFIREYRMGYQIIGSPNLKATIEKQTGIIVSKATEGEFKYCFTVPTGMWVCRRNERINVTGNSGKDYSCKRLITTRGYMKVAFADALRDIAFSIIGVTHEEGTKNYEQLKQTKLIGDLTLRNIMENLGAGIRKYDENFWVKAALVNISKIYRNICISDLRYYNEYVLLKNYCKDNNINFKLIFCDYHSPNYNDKNTHESARLAKYLKSLGYKDQQEVSDADMQAFSLVEYMKKD